MGNLGAGAVGRRDEAQAAIAFLFDDLQPAPPTRRIVVAQATATALTFLDHPGAPVDRSRQLTVRQECFEGLGGGKRGVLENVQELDPVDQHLVRQFSLLKSLVGEHGTAQDSFDTIPHARAARAGANQQAGKRRRTHTAARTETRIGPPGNL